MVTGATGIEEVYLAYYGWGYPYGFGYSYWPGNSYGYYNNYYRMIPLIRTLTATRLRVFAGQRQPTANHRVTLRANSHVGT